MHWLVLAATLAAAYPYTAAGVDHIMIGVSDLDAGIAARRVTNQIFASYSACVPIQPQRNPPSISVASAR